MSVTTYRIRQFVIILTICLSGWLLFYSLTSSKNQNFTPRAARYNQITTVRNVVVLHSDKDRSERKKTSNSISLSEETCNIPKLDINNSQVIRYFKRHEPLPCQLNNEKIENNWVFINDEGIVKFSEKRKKASCKLQYFWRVNDEKNDFSETIPIEDGFVMEKSDYATVACIQGFKKWNSTLWSLTPKSEAYEKAKLKKVEKNDDEKKPYNIYFLGFDSLSQMSFRRKLPKTVKYLEEVIGSVVLNGYNIVGDGTPQAFIPILTGQTEEELPLTRKRYKNASYVDDVYPFVWKNFSDAGYMTMYAEDAFNIGTFTYRLKGFRNEPTDHYTRTFFQMTEYMGLSNCIGSIPLHRMWFQNSRRFMKIYKDVPRFLLMHQSLLSHDDINLVEVEDEDLKANLKYLNEEGTFDDSFLIVMADHGHRFASLRETHQGQLEERLPFFSIQLPKKLRETEKGKKMLKNLKENQEKLTSPFDIHATLLDIINLPSDQENNDYEKMQDATKHRSLSLFRPIPEKRTCSQAGIEAHWCTCLSWQDALIEASDKRLSNILAQTVVHVINNELALEIELCSPLELDELIYAKKLLPEKSLLAYKAVKDADGFVPDLSGHTSAAFAHYQLKIKTKPGNAIYEVTLFYDFMKDEAKVDFGSISHINKYGDTPHCIVDKNFYLATFCVCYDKI